MKVMIVDTSFLRDAELAAFLADRASSHVGLTEYSAMECYKGDANRNISRSMEIIARYPEQVLVLKGVREVIREQAQAGPTAPAFDFVDRSQTEHFREFCRDVFSAANGDEFLRSRVLAHGEAAAQQLARVRDDAAIFLEGIRELAASFSPSQLKELRGETEILSEETADVLRRQILVVTATLFDSHPDVDRPPKSFEALRETFMFRSAVVGCLLALRWVSHGGIETVSMDKLRNDLVDTNYIVYATFFDGLLSNDTKMLKLYQYVRLVLNGALAS